MAPDVEQALATATLVTHLMGGASSAMSLYLTANSGYMFVAYLRGKELMVLQVVIITTLFVFFVSANTIATASYMHNAVYYRNTYGLGRVPSWGGGVMSTIQGLGILASVKFMWDIRHPKAK
jgi:hypothetical protein